MLPADHTIPRGGPRSPMRALLWVGVRAAARSRRSGGGCCRSGRWRGRAQRVGTGSREATPYMGPSPVARSGARVVRGAVVCPQTANAPPVLPARPFALPPPIWLPPPLLLSILDPFLHDMNAAPCVDAVWSCNRVGLLPVGRQSSCARSLMCLGTWRLQVRIWPRPWSVE
jgi:hypothetical protein